MPERFLPLVSNSIVFSVENIFCNAPKAVSKPIAPYEAFSNSTFFSSISIGQWSVVTKSITPSFKPLIKAFISLEVLRGGVTW